MDELTHQQRVELADRISDLLNGLSIADALDITVTVAASAVSQWLCGHGVPEEKALEIGLLIKRTVAEMLSMVAEAVRSKGGEEDDEELSIDDDDELML